METSSQDIPQKRVSVQIQSTSFDKESSQPCTDSVPATENVSTLVIDKSDATQGNYKPTLKY